MSGKRLRLLCLLPFPPRLDATDGGSRVAAQLLAHLSARHRVALLYLRAPGDPPLDLVLRNRCEVVQEVMRPNPGFSLASGWARSTSLLRGWPLWAAGCSVSAFSAQVKALTQTWRPDIVQIEFHVMGQYLLALDGCPAPRVLTQHEPGTAAARDRLQFSHGIMRAIRYWDMLAWERFERAILKRVQAIVVFTERDRCAVSELVADTPITIVPFGTMLSNPLSTQPGEEPLDLLFVGNFKHPPNSDAAIRLASGIFPRVQARVPAARLYIVGDQPTAPIRKFASDAVRVTGRVPDVIPYLHRAAVVVVPLRMGGGMRVKVVEALAAGKAVVASRLAVEGLNVVHQRDLVLAETDEQFADAVLRLLSHPEERAALADRAGAWAQGNLGWDRPIEAYETLYESLMRCSEVVSLPAKS